MLSGITGDREKEIHVPCGNVSVGLSVRMSRCQLAQPYCLASMKNAVVIVPRCI